MKPKSVLTVSILLLGVMVLFSQCEFFVGEHKRGNLTIDTYSLFPEASGDGRYIGIPPAGVVSFTVTVSGPGITTFEKTILPGTRYINMSVPSGLKRTIRLDANLDPAYMASINHEHMLSIAGESTVDILPGRIVMCVFHMGAGMTKPIIPDYGNMKVVRIPHMHPTTITPVTWSEYLITGPRDITIDSIGNVIITNGTTTIYQLNQILTPNVVTPITLTNFTNPVPSISVDNVNNRIYTYGNVGAGAPYYSIYYYTYLPPTGYGNLAPPTGLSTGTNQVAAIKYHNGVFYLAGNQMLPHIFKYTPGATPSTIEASSPMLVNPQDILIKGAYCYVANYPLVRSTYSPTDYATIEVFDKDSLAYIGSYGTRTNTSDDNTPGHFYGPFHFVAITNKKIYVVDDGYSINQGRNRIIAFDDIQTWAGWETFRAEDILTNPEFRFYDYAVC